MALVVSQLGWRKPVSLLQLDGQGEGTDPRRCMGVVDLIAFGIGSCVGAGVFVTTGQIAALTAGPSAWLSFLLAGVAALLSGLCYAEFASRLPLSGGVYAYAYATFGEMMGFSIGWNMTLLYAISAGGVAISWANYLLSFIASFGVDIPVGASAVELNDSFQVYPLALGIVLLLLLVLLAGTGESSRFNVAITVWNIALIVFVIIYGATFIDSDNYSPFMPFGFEGVLSGAGVAFFSYIGFDAVSTMSGEAKNPRRDVPIGLMGALGISGTLYCLLAAVISGMVPAHVLALPAYQNAPVAEAFLHVGRPWATKLVAFGSVTTLTCTTLCSLMGQARVFFPMAQDGLLPPIFGRLDRRGVPLFSVLFTGVVAGVLALFFKFDDLVNAISLGAFINYSVCCGGTLVLRMTTIASDPSATKVLKTGKWRRPMVSSRVAVAVLSSYMIGSWIFWFTYYQAHPSLAVNIVLGLILIGCPLCGLLYIYFFTEIPVPPNTFHCPFMPAVALAAIFVNSVLMAGLGAVAYIYVAVWLAAGYVIYFGYGIRHSAFAHYKATAGGTRIAMASPNQMSTVEGKSTDGGKLAVAAPNAMCEPSCEEDSLYGAGHPRQVEGGVQIQPVEVGEDDKEDIKS